MKKTFLPVPALGRCGNLTSWGFRFRPPLLIKSRGGLTTRGGAARPVVVDWLVWGQFRWIGGQNQLLLLHELRGLRVFSACDWRHATGKQSSFSPMVVWYASSSLARLGFPGDYAGEEALLVPLLTAYMVITGHQSLVIRANCTTVSCSLFVESTSFHHRDEKFSQPKRLRFAGGGQWFP